MNRVAVQILLADGVEAPTYATDGAAGMDLQCAEDFQLAPGEHRLVPTGLRIALPEGYEAQVRTRSGLALRHGISMVNSPGTIDWDYRGEIGVILINHGREDVQFNRGDRIGQLVVAPVARVTWEKVDELEGTVRGDGGFGSTGS
jgi:dUTP pyrophosphatase